MCQMDISVNLIQYVLMSDVYIFQVMILGKKTENRRPENITITST